MKNGVGYIYIMTNVVNSVVYIGVTSNLKKRIYEHKHRLVDGFTKKYNVNKLIYFEKFDSILNAIEREKQIKGWLRKKEDELIYSFNPNWQDLYHQLD